MTDFFRDLLPCLSTPLPRVWKAVEGGLSEPIPTHQQDCGQLTMGGDHRVDLMRGSALRFDSQTQAQLRKPIKGWLTSLELVRVRIHVIILHMFDIHRYIVLLLPDITCEMPFV